MTLLDSLRDSFNGPAWHGPALWPSLRGVSEEQAAWRPAAGRHNIREIAVHAAYWKHVVRQRVTGGRDRFPLRGRNWFPRPGGEGGWAADRELLAHEHERLLEAVATLGPRALARKVKGPQTAEENIRGIASHDVYHAGQIQLIKAFSRRRSKNR